ncbi:MAG: phosphoenolpyruvate--protein phosphotransferase [Candidatus Cloacimonadota bacterium]|nr:MAG: phosphoenolpyruvate--protein phosphotransferase [Candidatus Cloacimonadota bacterium]
MLRGIAVSFGIAIGPAFLYEETGILLKGTTQPIENTEKEIIRFKQAIKKSKKQLLEIKKGLVKKLGFTKANFLDVQILALEDEWIFDETIKKIKEERKEATQAIFEISNGLLAKFEEIDDPYLRERTSDIKDVTRRIIKNLTDKQDKSISFTENMILVARNLSPSDTAQLEKEKVLAFLTDFGGKNSHTAIMARALEIPAIVGLRELTNKITLGEKIIVDGYSGVVVINPSEKTLKNYEKKRKHLLDIEKELLCLKDLPATTVDGHSIDLSANIEFPDDAESAKNHGARGIGLFRTEFLFLTEGKPPDEKMQYNEYKQVVDSMYPDTVIFRTLDLGGDKIFENAYPENNPFLGWRAIRFLLSRKDLFKTQLRAILRASERHTVRIMFPMISDLSEIIKAKNILREVADELEREGIPFDKDMEIGIMVEIPSVAILADDFAKEADFFSIGTNDLTQYILAVDRTNERVASLYDHLHPAVLRTIKTIIEAAHRNSKWVGVCGEIAGDPLAIPVLLGVEVDELSTSPMVIPEVKKVIRTLSLKEAKTIAGKCLMFSTAKEVRAFLCEIINTKLPVIKELILGVVEDAQDANTKEKPGDNQRK